MSMVFGEWDWDVAKDVWQEEAREEGMEKILDLMDKGYFAPKTRFSAS